MTALRIGIVAGEASGDALASEIVDAIRARHPDAALVGVGGEALARRGLASLFDPDEIAIVGVTAVLARLPRLVSLIGRTARALAAEKPDVVLLVDAPDFTHRVAARLRQAAPEIPIVKLVAPTVWAWRPGRAAALRPVVDEVLALFPHEPSAMAEFGGPPTTFIGHPLADAIPVRPTRPPGAPPRLVVLPGSRGKEVRALARPFGETLAVLRERIGPFEVVLPTLANRRALVERETAAWTVRPEIVVGEEVRAGAFADADAALAASGTVTLELALHGVPTVVAYKLDALERQVARLITTWAIAMPNIIADRLVMPELVNETVRPQRMARLLERLVAATPERAAQLDGFAEMRRRLATEAPAAEIAAGRVLALAERGRAVSRAG